MDSFNIQISYEEYDSVEEMQKNDRALIEQAEHSSEAAYAPYSGFFVGAAVLLENEEIITGNNQENMAYPSGLCAERVALFYASANYPGVPVKAIAITARSDKRNFSEIVTPCGSCRQVMAEYEFNQQKPIRVLMKASSGKVRVVEGMNKLLPMMFRTDVLRNS